MFFRQIYDEGLAQAAYLIGCQRTGEAIVVDPARDVDRYVALAARHDLRLVAAAETHIHADFLSGARELAEQVGVHLYLSDAGPADWKYGWLDARRGGGTYAHTLVRDGDTFRVGNIGFRVVHTPGHTPEHVSYLVTDDGGGASTPMGALTGDFVFVGDLGRPDLLETAAGVAGAKESSARDLYASARGFLKLDDWLQVWPAHGAGSACGKALGAVPQSTVGYERRFNPALRLTGDGDAFVDFILDGQPEPPLYFARMKQQNRDGVPLLGPLPAPRELESDAVADAAARYVVVDTRDWDAFRAGHLPGALFAPLGSTFHSVAGSYLQPADEILLVATPDQVELAVRELVRIGLDRVVAWVAPRTLADSGAAGERVRTVDVDELRRKLDTADADDVTVLDVRRKTELAEGSIARFAVHAAHTHLPRHLERIPRDRPVYVHCATGRRSAAAVAYLRRHGYDAIQVDGGYSAWQLANGAAVGTTRNA